MKIEQKETETQGEYTLIIKGQKAGELLYSVSPGRIIISHTQVNRSFEGQGLGKQLVKRAVEDARKGSYKIVPLCPFANKVIKGDSSLQDVL